MLITKKHLLTMLAMAGILGASSASAAVSTAGDLFLGFRVTSGTGAGTDLVVRAGAAGPTGGNAINFRDAVASIPNVVDVGAELTAIYGAGWHTRADLFWGVVGTRSSGVSAAGSGTNGNVPTRSPFIGIAQASSTPGAQNSTAPVIPNSTLRQNVAANIVGLRSNVFTPGADTGVSAAEAVTGSSSALGSYTTAQSTFFGLAGGTEVSNASGIDNTGLDLYWVLDQNTGALDNGAAVTSAVGTGIWQGSFHIDSSGIVSFSAVPEPSRALLAGLGVAGLGFRRRRTAKSAA